MKIWFWPAVWTQPEPNNPLIWYKETSTHDAAVLFIIHFLHLEAVRLRGKKQNLYCVNAIQKLCKAPMASAAKTGQEQSAVNTPDIQTSRPGTFGWWASCLEWPCEGKCSGRAASKQSVIWRQLAHANTQDRVANGATCTHRLDGF